MTTRKKSFSFSTKNINAPAVRESNLQMQEEEIQKTDINSIEYYLEEIIKNINNPNSPSFLVAISSFQKFIINKYQSEMATHNEKTFIDELFRSISINQARTSLEYTTFTKAIVSAEFSDKILIANKVSNTINYIQPDPNRLTWENFGDVLEFLKKSLKNGVYLIISNLKTLSQQWIQDKDTMIAGYYLLNIILKKFPEFFYKYFSQNKAMIVSGITKWDGPDAVFESVDIIIDIQKKEEMRAKEEALQEKNDLYPKQGSFQGKKKETKLFLFCDMLIKLVESKTFTKNIMLALEKVMDVYPELARQLEFNINPIELFKDIKNGDNILNGLQTAPFYVRTLKNISESKEKVNKLVDLYYNFLSHRSPYRVEALISLGNVLFIAKMNNFIITPDLQAKLSSKLTKYFDIDQVYYTYIALMTMLDAKNFDKDAKLIFNINRPINQWIVDGFCKYCKTLDKTNKDSIDLKEKIDRIFLVYFNNIILNPSSPDRIIFALKGILKLDISMDLIQIPLVLKYSLLMNNTDQEIKKLTVNFILKFHRKRPTLEILCRILTIIGTEFTPLRVEIFRDLEPKYWIPEHPAVIPLLVSLLHDSSKHIQKYSLQFLVKLIHLDGVSAIITDFLREICESMKLSKGQLSKTALSFFVIVCEAKDPIFKTILLPFSDFLINHILQIEMLPRIGLVILSYMIPISLNDTIKRIDIDNLVKHIEQSLVPHSTPKRLESAFDLLLAALERTDLRLSIYDKHFNILNKLHVICQLNKNSVNQNKLLVTLSSIGAINPEFVKTQLNSIFDNQDTSDVVVNTPMFFLSIAPYDKINEKCIFAANGIAIKTLLEILNEKTLSTLFTAAIEALEKIIKSGSDISDILLKEVFHHISSILKNDDNPSNVSKMIAALKAMVGFLREKIEPLIPSIVEYIISNWKKFDQTLLLKIVEFIPIICGHELLKSYIFKLASLFVSDLNNCAYHMADDIYSVFVSLSGYLPIISPVIFPPLIAYINNHAYDTKACHQLLSKLSSLLSSKKGGKEYSAQIIRTMVRIVSVNKELSDSSLAVIRILAELMGPIFLLYLPSIQSAFTIHPNDELSQIINIYKSGGIYAVPEKTIKLRKETVQTTRVQGSEVAFNDTNNFEKPPKDSNDENAWIDWWDKFSEAAFEKCPSKAVKVCNEIAKKYTIMKDKLFPITFSIFRTIPTNTTGSSNIQKYQWLDEWLRIIISSAPTSILRTFLSIYEIYEVLEITTVNIDDRVFAKKAMETDSYALAIHIYEKIFLSERRRISEDTAKSLITLNQHLGFEDAANGILKVSNTQEQSELSEKLGLWEDALKQYLNIPSGQNALGPDFNIISACAKLESKPLLSVMNCLNHLSRFSELNNLASYVLNGSNYSNSTEMRFKSLRFAAYASWHQFNYVNFKKYAEDFITEVNLSKNDKFNDDDECNNENNYLILMFKILNKDLESAKEIIQKIRNDFCKKLFPMIGENYELVYEDFSLASTLSEVEELIQYLELDERARSPEKVVREDAFNSMLRIRKLWNVRFSKLKPMPSVLHNHLCIRSIVLPISEQREEFLTLISSSIEQNRLELAESILSFCESKDLKCEKYKTMGCKLIWARGEKKKAIDSLSSLELTKETNMTLSQWLFEYGDPLKARAQLEKEISSINQLDKNSLIDYNSDLAFSEWEVWANINLVLSKSYPTNNNYIIDSLEGFMNALSVAKSNSVLTFTLRILHVLFNHECDSLFAKFGSIVKSGKVSLSVWSDVIIQLLSRLASSNLGLRKTIGDLITMVGLMHPHSVLLSLMVMTYFENTERQKISREIINEIRLKHPQIVSSLTRFSFELQKVALTWWEATVCKIDEVSRTYADNIKHDNLFNSSVPPMINNNNQKSINEQINPQCFFYMDEICRGLKSLDKMVLAQPFSFYEISYNNEFGHTMEVASHWRKVYERTKDITAFQVCWSYYTTAFYAIRPLLANFNNFSLCDSSPYLYNFSSENVQIPVPGTYSISEESKPVFIASLDENVTIIDSKQRPRRIDLHGDDGNKYTFLLKAHEDTRLDERIMQFFSYINTCIFDKKKSSNLTDNFRNRLTITTYKVSPLTPEVGMIGFVRNCTTLFDLVKNYREKKSIKLKAEYDHIIAQYCDKYDELPLGDARIKYFRFGYDACDGNDLKTTLFNSSDDSMDWLQRRTTYTASLAMTSMVGHVLGLGDRHLCNIMMNKRTGKLVHIDFGDSFEVAQNRANFPEKVPFRLTRLLQNALEVSRIEGTFRKSCENTLGMMRTNAEQIIGLLSAFIYDPLNQWAQPPNAKIGEQNRKNVLVKNSPQIDVKEEQKVINRIADKLAGNDFVDKKNLKVEEQVERLINDATDVKNLCMMYQGWYPWW